MKNLLTRILVVDDDPQYQQLLKVNLESKGFDVICSDNGLNALGFVVDNNPDLVILDIMMPVLDGLSTCERIRQISNIPVIILTARSEEPDLVRGLNIGADDYIVKPFSASELIARVKAVLRRSQGIEPLIADRYFVHDNLKIDFASAEVWLDNKTVELSSTEYKLLIYFASHVGKILTPEDLLTAVWGPQYCDDKEILWVNIARLRHRLEEKASMPKHIVTISGSGYIMPSG